MSEMSGPQLTGSTTDSLNAGVLLDLLNSFFIGWRDFKLRRNSPGQFVRIPNTDSSTFICCLEQRIRNLTKLQPTAFSNPKRSTKTFAKRENLQIMDRLSFDPSPVQNRDIGW